jgi:hypothetical protein
MALYPTSLTGEQIEAVTRSMVNYQNNLARNSYVSKVLATNPVCYWPCTQNIGSFLEDVSGNKAHGMAYFTPVGQTANDYGKTIAGVSGDENKYITSTPNWATLTGLNLNEFSCGGWFKVSDNPANQIRPFNHRANSLTEYATPEIRDGLTLGIFMRESGVDQNVSSVVELPDNEWVHIVFYNSLSAGEMGFYVGATRYNISKTTPGFTDTSPDQVLCGQELEGFFNHLSWWDHSVSQSTVNSLL